MFKLSINCSSQLSWAASRAGASFHPGQDCVCVWDHLQPVSEDWQCLEIVSTWKLDHCNDLVSLCIFETKLAVTNSLADKPISYEDNFCFNTLS